MKLSTPVGLLQNAGPIGHILRQLPRWVLDKAETQRDPWAWLENWITPAPVTAMPLGKGELKREGFKRAKIGVYTANENAMLKFGIKEIRFYKDEPDKLIVERIGWPDSFRKTFLAAASQRNAFNRLARIARGEASLATDSLENMLEEMGKPEVARDEVKLNQAAENVALARARYDLFHASAQNDPDPEVRQAYRHYICMWRKEEVKRGRGNAAKQAKLLPRANDVQGELILLFMLAEWWVSFGDSPVPGFMFWGNKAVTKYLSNLTGRKLKPDFIKKRRRALRLLAVSGEGETPFVWDITIERYKDAEWKIDGRQRDKKPAFVFWGAIKYNGKTILPPKSLPVSKF